MIVFQFIFLLFCLVNKDSGSLDSRAFRYDDPVSNASVTGWGNLVFRTQANNCAATIQRIGYSGVGASMAADDSYTELFTFRIDLPPNVLQHGV